MAHNPKDALTHFDAGGRPRMVDVSAKTPTMRMARASGFVRMSDAALDLVRERASKRAILRRLQNLPASWAPNALPISFPCAIPCP